MEIRFDRDEILENARRIRKQIESVVVYAPDNVAVTNLNLYPLWNGESAAYIVDDRVRYEDKLYKCRQAHTSQAGWEPDKTPAMWAVIDVTHAGTLEDPIPAAENMEYTEGIYYLDPQDGKTYLCTRSTGQPVTYLPHALVGTYFEEVA